MKLKCSRDLIKIIKIIEAEFFPPIKRHSNIERYEWSGDGAGLEGGGRYFKPGLPDGHFESRAVCSPFIHCQIINIK